MSRPMKLIILAIFMVLLSIVAVYVSLTWSPENPLRIRLLSQEKPEKEDPFKHLAMQIEVENASSVSIHLSDTQFCARWKPGANARAAPVFVRSVLFQSEDGLIPQPLTIAPQSSQRFSIGIAGYDPKSVNMESAKILYEFRSDTKRRVAEFRDRISPYIPASVKRHLPRPSRDQAAASLESPSN